MRIKLSHLLFMAMLFQFNNLKAEEQQVCKPAYTVNSIDHLEEGINNYLACFKLVGSQLDEAAKSPAITTPLQLVTHSLNRAKFYNLYAKAMSVYGKIQLEYMNYFLDSLYETEKLSKADFTRNFLAMNVFVQDISSISLSEDQRNLLMENGQNITKFLEEANSELD